MSTWKTKLAGLAAPMKAHAEKACQERMNSVCIILLPGDCHPILTTLSRMESSKMLNSSSFDTRRSWHEEAHGLSRGTQLHTSHDGSGKRVISIQMLNERNARIETIHVDEQGDVDVKKKDR
nr:hypothetical protein CFP56_54912 [Quercus suber]